MKRTILCAIILAATLSARAQNRNDEPVALPFFIDDNGDTIPNVNIKTVTVRRFSKRRQQIKYDKLVRNVKKAYPFAVAARDELANMNAQLVGVEGRDRERYIKEYEKQMFKKYEKDLRALTISQGRILLKLVDREIDNTAYELVKEYRGSFSAFFWQGVARLFGENLKSEYDPDEEDMYIEEIVQLIEAGVI
ncbi:MAG: DUF4294 domain-containing protein [Salinivirgaceae bacterium]|nr:DUF4294 domain-containing protein [Salinivirgaceae bacterium]MBR4621464.1 DUF4294 domain-containing protein [Salinivirgaceae bacterium]